MYCERDEEKIIKEGNEKWESTRNDKKIKNTVEKKILPILPIYYYYYYKCEY